MCKTKTLITLKPFINAVNMAPPAANLVRARAEGNPMSLLTVVVDNSRLAIGFCKWKIFHKDVESYNSKAVKHYVKSIIWYRNFITAKNKYEKKQFHGICLFWILSI